MQKFYIIIIVLCIQFFSECINFYQNHCHCQAHIIYKLIQSYTCSSWKLVSQQLLSLVDWPECTVFVSTECFLAKKTQVLVTIVVATMITTTNTTVGAIINGIWRFAPPTWCTVNNIIIVTVVSKSSLHDVQSSKFPSSFKFYNVATRLVTSLRLSIPSLSLYTSLIVQFIN